jgi:hypothetical protein
MAIVRIDVNYREITITSDGAHVGVCGRGPLEGEIVEAMIRAHSRPPLKLRYFGPPDEVEKLRNNMCI